MSTATRLSGRQHDEIRPLSIVFEGLDRVDGSARFGFGTTSALASLSGPIEVRLANELPNKATFEVLVRPLANISATDAKATAAAMKAALEPSLLLAKNPRTLVQLVLQSLSAPLMGSSSWGSTTSWDGQEASSASPAAVATQWREVLLLPALINASSLALLNASSVPMRGVVVAVSVGRLVSLSSAPPSEPITQSHLVVDPSDDEATKLQAGGCFAFLFADGAGLAYNGENVNADCVWSGWKALSGGYDDTELFAARSLALKGARRVYEKIRARMAGREDEPEAGGMMAGDESRNDSTDIDDDEKMEI